MSGSFAALEGTPARRARRCPDPPTRLYRVYGLTIACNRPLDALSEVAVTRGPADVSIELGERPAWVEAVTPEPPETLDRHASGHGATRAWIEVARWPSREALHLRYSHGVEFVVDARGARVWGGSRGSGTLEDVEADLLGAVLALVVRLRGRVVLHAGAIAVADRALLLLGPGGAGKSTTSALFARLGDPVLTDDVSVITDGDGPPTVIPGYPRLRLWPDGVRVAFGEAAASLPRLSPSWDKRYLPLTDATGLPFRSTPLPLGAIYVMGGAHPGPEPRIETLRPAERLMALVANSHPRHLLDADLRRAEFGALAELARRVAVRRVISSAQPDRADALCAAIRADFVAVVEATGDS